MEENPFKQLETHKEVPKEIKVKIMDNIEALELFMELGDLFSRKFCSIFESFLKTKK